MSPNPPKIDWVPCPICGEPDMEREPDDDGFIITCTNLVCASNGGDNRAALKCEAIPARPGKRWAYHSENLGGNLHDAVAFIRTYHPEWDVVAMDHMGFNTVVVYREELP